MWVSGRTAVPKLASEHLNLLLAFDNLQKQHSLGSQDDSRFALILRLPVSHRCSTDHGACRRDLRLALTAKDGAEPGRLVRTLTDFHAKTEFYLHMPNFKTMLVKRVLAFTAVLIPLSADATDLSAGVKGLRIGMPRAEVLTALETMSKDANGVFAPACRPEGSGESCIDIGSNLTYGRSRIAVTRFGFGPAGLNELSLTLSKAGCESSSKDQLHPRDQFATLNKLMTEQFGPSSGNDRRKVWVDDTAVLVLDIGPPEHGMNVYKNCESTSVSYIDRAKALARLKAAEAKGKDL
jgi:hypothetical protein